MNQDRRRINRRSFLRVAGISASAGVVAAGVYQGVNNARYRLEIPAEEVTRPWWVKTADRPTSDIDWDRMRRFDERMASVRGPGLASYIGQDRADQLASAGQESLRARLAANVPGYGLKDHALSGAHAPHPALSFIGPQRAKTPEEWGVPTWTGTPEDAARILRAAMRHFGAANIGFTVLDERTRKLIYSVDPDGKQLRFTNRPVAYESSTTRHIPIQCKYVIVYSVQMSEETLRRAPTVLASQTTALSYLRGAQIQSSTQEFLRGLGYQCLGSGFGHNGLGIAPAFAVLAGLGEMGRSNRLITPEFGPMVRVFRLLTDLPIATDSPIDAGILEFCKHCRKCAEACPAGAISFETEPSWETSGGWNNVGHKAWFEDAVKCRSHQLGHAGTNCGICFAVCPFAKKDQAWVHQFAKAGISSFPFIDPSLRSLDDALGYGAQKDPEDWWRLDLPEYGIDTSR